MKHTKDAEPKSVKNANAPAKRACLPIDKNNRPMIPNAKMDEIKTQGELKRICHNGTSLIYHRFVLPKARLIVGESMKMCQRLGYKTVTRAHGEAVLKEMRTRKAPRFTMA